MVKKFGVSVGLLSAIIFFAGYSSWLACVVLLVAVLCFASDEITLKTNALSATVLSFVVSIIQIVLRFLSNTYLKFMNTLAEAFMDIDTVYKIIDWLRDVDFADFLIGLVSIIYFIMTVLFMLKAVKGNVVNVPIITKKIRSHLSGE